MAIFESCAYALTFNKPPLNFQLYRYHFLRVHFRKIFRARFVWQKKITGSILTKTSSIISKKVHQCTKKVINEL